MAQQTDNKSKKLYQIKSKKKEPLIVNLKTYCIISISIFYISISYVWCIYTDNFSMNNAISFLVRCNKIIVLSGQDNPRFMKLRLK